MLLKGQITINKRSTALWTTTFNNPPINLIDPDTIAELQDLVASLESDPEVKVVVFRSADPDFFLAHWDVLADKAKVAAMPPGPTGLHPWADVLVRLSRAPVASIAEIRGRARGAGSEFVLSCDMRFASRERAILGQFEVGMGAVPGGNPMARLAGLMGRGRGLEVILGAMTSRPISPNVTATSTERWPMKTSKRSWILSRAAWPPSKSMRWSAPRPSWTKSRCRPTRSFNMR